ncbi:MAG: crossover junction endodeoxyribonuclease RuvC [Rickettsiales bacterium]|nr:MAG: crossover junction endodeoxyribonuclease RuvC [Rickettsiales bacterium]
MKILGIDPALTALGWGVILSESPKIIYVDSGLIKTKPATPLHFRLANIADSIEEAIDLHQPDVIAMEETFVNKNAVSSLKLGYVRGALMALIGKKNIPFYEYKPNNIKKTITGVGHADKEQVKHMVQMIISGTNPKISLDESDALAIAYTCLANQR